MPSSLRIKNAIADAKTQIHPSTSPLASLCNPSWHNTILPSIFGPDDSSAMLVQPPPLAMKLLRLLPLLLLQLPLPSPLIPCSEPFLPCAVLLLERRVLHHAAVHGALWAAAGECGQEAVLTGADCEVYVANMLDSSSIQELLQGKCGRRGEGVALSKWRCALVPTSYLVRAFCAHALVVYIPDLLLLPCGQRERCSCGKRC